MPLITNTSISYGYNRFANDVTWFATILILIFVLLVQLIVGLITLQEKLALLALLGAGLVLQILYLPYQVKRQMQD